jgi:hypothetical protein
MSEFYSMYASIHVRCKGKKKEFFSLQLSVKIRDNIGTARRTILHFMYQKFFLGSDSQIKSEFLLWKKDGLKLTKKIAIFHYHQLRVRVNGATMTLTFHLCNLDDLMVTWMVGRTSATSGGYRLDTMSRHYR